MYKPFALILENNSDNAALFCHVLDLAGFLTEIVSDSQAIVERLSNSQPNIVILNLDLTGLSGNQILKLIRKEVRLQNTKVIAVTSQQILSNSLSIEPDILLFTPISTEQFSDFIERFLLKVKYQTTIPMLGEPWDRVTGVSNQLFFTNRLKGSLIQSKEINQYLFAVLIVNIDQNNIIKNQLDMRNWIIAIRETAEALKVSVRPTDIVARFDLDNFYILLENVMNKDFPLLVASRIYSTVNEKLAGLGKKVQFPIWIGILLCDSGYENIDEILRDTRTARSLRKPQEAALEYFDRASIGDQLCEDRT